MNGEPSKHLNPLPAPMKQSTGRLSTKDLGKLCQKMSGVEPPSLQMELIREVAETLPFDSYSGGNEYDEKIATALDASRANPAAGCDGGDARRSDGRDALCGHGLPAARGSS